jgi:hypothetical protein
MPEDLPLASQNSQKQNRQRLARAESRRWNVPASYAGVFRPAQRFSNRSALMDATSYLNPSDPLPYRSVSDQDFTHRFSVSNIYELPFGKGHFLSGALTCPIW